MWTRKLTWPGEGNHTDWLVLYKHIKVGRARLDTTYKPTKWNWSVQILPASQGYGDTMEEALEAVRKWCLNIPDLEKQIEAMRIEKEMHPHGRWHRRTHSHVQR